MGWIRSLFSGAWHERMGRYEAKQHRERSGKAERGIRRSGGVRPIGSFHGLIQRKKQASFQSGAFLRLNGHGHQSFR